MYTKFFTEPRLEVFIGKYHRIRREIIQYCMYFETKPTTLITVILRKFYIKRMGYIREIESKKIVDF